MKQSIHPTYYTDATVTCSCGHSFTTGSTKREIRVEVCSNCHPLYTGEKRYVDTLGRVDRFQQKQKKAAEMNLGKKKKTQKVEEKQAYRPKSLKELLTDM